MLVTSPTSRIGTPSPSSPGGSIDHPIDPVQFALGSGATFSARCVDIDQKALPGILNAGQSHKGTAFVEILQNCIVYNKDVWGDVAAKKTAADTQVVCEHGQPLIYGKERDRGLRLNPQSLTLEAVTLGEGGVQESDVLVHDETNPMIAQLLCRMGDGLPTAMGVIHRREAPSFETAYRARKTLERKTLVKDLLRRGNLLDRR